MMPARGPSESTAPAEPRFAGTAGFKATIAKHPGAPPTVNGRVW